MNAPIAVDASVIVRYLTGDDKIQSAAAADLFRAAQAGKVSLILPTATVQETVYVLEKVYQLEAATIAPKLLSLLALPNVTAPDARWLAEAIQFYRIKNGDFGDALLCGFAQQQDCHVATFDKGILKKFPEVPAFTPIDWLQGKVPKRVKDQN